MAKLGVRSISELVGRTDLLKSKVEKNNKAASIDLSRILCDMSGLDRADQVFDARNLYDFKLEDTVDEKVLLKDKNVLKAVKDGKACEISVDIKNTDRTFGTLLGAEITRLHPEGLTEDTVTVNCHTCYISLAGCCTVQCHITDQDIFARIVLCIFGSFNYKFSA